MSSINIATLPRMSREALSALLLSTSSVSNLAVVDVRDSGKKTQNRQRNVLKILY